MFSIDRPLGRVAFYGEPIKGKQRLGIPAGHTLPIDVPVPVTPDPFVDRVLGNEGPPNTDARVFWQDCSRQ